LANPLKDLSFQTLFDAAADAMLLVNDTGHVVEANAAALALLEYTEDAILGLSVEALIPERFRHHHHQYRDDFFKNPEKRTMGNGRDLFALSSSGKELAVDIGLSPIKTPDQVYILITFYVADKRREAEQALSINEERLRLAKQAANFGVFDLDPKKLVFHCDEKMLELWGGKPDKAISYEAFIAAINPEDRAARQVEFDRCLDPTSNGEYRIEYRITNPNDGIERWVSSVGKVHFKNGEAVRFIGVVRDITEHKTFEKIVQEHRAVAEDVLQHQVASLTSSAIAHELNQPLAAVSAYGEVALRELGNATINPEKLKHALESCVAQAQRAGTSLHELMTFLQASDLITERFDLNDCVKEALVIAYGEGFVDFQPILHIQKNMPAVLANRIQIQKVLVNLLINAAEAMRDPEITNNEISITVRTHKDMNMAHVTVKDSGPGINQEIYKRIFEPFFTTKQTGIGMGLAISRPLIEANGGQLWLEPSHMSKNTKPGNAKPGATFHITLPFAP
jgi:two-component system, LuxR family, sensor kinase FixL